VNLPEKAAQGREEFRVIGNRQKSKKIWIFAKLLHNAPDGALYRNEETEPVHVHTCTAEHQTTKATIMRSIGIIEAPHIYAD
jgi:hypothetical protein